MTNRRLYVSLTADAMERLADLAADEWRHPSDQAAVLVLRGLGLPAPEPLPPAGAACPSRGGRRRALNTERRGASFLRLPRSARWTVSEPHARKGTAHAAYHASDQFSPPIFPPSAPALSAAPNRAPRRRCAMIAAAPTTTTPHLAPTFDGIPEELRARPQWVVWRPVRRDGEPKPAKIPYDPRNGTAASTTAPTTWASFAAARAAYETGGYAGAARVLPDDPYVGLDLDDVRDPETGELDPWATRC